MKKLFLSLLVLASTQLFAATKMETVEVDGFERNYWVVSPTAPVAKTHPVVMVLHGVGGTAEDYLKLFDAQTLSDLHDALFVFPQALPEQDAENLKAVDNMKKLGVMPDGLELKNPWGAGARISAATIKEMAGDAAALLNFVIPTIMKKGYGELNETVDDVKFLNTVISNLKSSFAASDDIYMAGASMGGAMVYKYAYSKNSQATKICAFNGFVGAGVDTTAKAINIPALIFNSKGDQLVQYEGGMFNGPVEETIKTIAAQNGCGAATSKPCEDLKADGNTVTEITYGCDDDKLVKCFISSTAAHTQVLNSLENDVDFFWEMEKFFFGNGNAGNENIVAQPLRFFPNPVEDKLYCEESGDCVVTDLAGRVVLSAEVVDGVADLSDLSAGYYIFTLKTANETLRARIVKK